LIERHLRIRNSLWEFAWGIASCFLWSVADAAGLQ
jgi:hypothetical protein